MALFSRGETDDSPLDFGAFSDKLNGMSVASLLPVLLRYKLQQNLQEAKKIWFPKIGIPPVIIHL